MTLDKGEQLLKTRDDNAPVRLRFDTEAPDPLKPFKVMAGCSWAKVNEHFGSDRLRHRIEPWLTALVQAEHLSVLAGSGLTHAVHHLGVGGAAAGMSSAGFVTRGKEISAEAEKSSKRAGRQSSNFEDELRVASELHRGLSIAASLCADDSPENKECDALSGEITKSLESFASAVLKSETSLATADNARREEAVNYLVSFLMSFASRAGTRERLRLFTTNYERYIELGAEAAGLRLIDRFVGTLAPWFRASRLDVDLHYNPPGIRGEPRYLEGVAHYTKLHGSIDWIDVDGAIRRFGLPFGADAIDPFLKAPGLGGDASRLMVYPNSAKDRETASYPYVELFRDFAAAVCRPNSVLFCYGYSFGDEHINRVVEDMLTIPSTHLVVISHGDPLGRIMSLYERMGRHAQTTLLLGDHLGDLRALVDSYLPKPAIDRTTFRMAELLKARWGSNGSPADAGSAGSSDEGLAP